MSVVFPINASSRYQQYTASGGQTVFSVPFPFQEDRDITVIKIAAADGVQTTLSLVTHYTLTGKGTAGPGSLTLVTPAVAGDKIRVIGAAILDRLTSIVRDGKYSSVAQDDEHDRHRLVQQELKRQADRAMKSDYGQAGLSIDTSAVTAGRVLMRGTGNDIVAGPDADEIANAQGYAESALASRNRAVEAEAASAVYADVAAAHAGFRLLKDIPTVKTDTELYYSGADPVYPGNVVTTRLEGHVYVVAPSAATDHHLTTAGGVKLYDRGAYASPAVAQTQQVMDRAAAGLPIDIMIFSDSLGAGPTRFPAKLGPGMKAALNDYTINVRYWNTGTANYDAPTTLASGTRGTCTLWVFAISGSIANRGLGQDFNAALTPGTLAGRAPDLVVINYGHNGGDSINIQLPLQAVAVGTISRRLPLTPIIVLGQNKSLVNDAMREKVRAFTHIVTALGCGFINVHAFFEDYGLTGAAYYADTVHTTDLGSVVWAYVFTRAFVRQPDAMRGVGRSFLNRGVIRAYEDYQTLRAAATLANCTAAEDSASGYWQTAGSSLKLTGDGVNAYAFASWTMLDSTQIIPYRNRTVTAMVIERVPTGSPSSLGRVSLWDGIKEPETAPPPVDLGDGFVGHSVSLEISGGATFLRLDVYLAQGAANSASLWIDRLNVVDGHLPGDPAVGSRDVGSITSGGNGIAIKHPNGDMTCRKTVAATSVAITTAWGSLFTSGDVVLGNWQENFLTIDHVTVRAVNTAGAVTAQPLTYGPNSTTGPRPIRLWSALSTAAADYTITVEGKGRWK